MTSAASPDVIHVSMSGVGRFDVLVQCGPMYWDSLISLWMRAVLVVMMRVNGVKSAVHDEMNEMCI